VSGPAGLGLLLASSSPRRLELLRQARVEPDRVVSPEIDETLRPRELPRAYAARMAQAKADVVAMRESGWLVLAADTVVACGRRVLPKCLAVADAEQCLALLSGRRHRVLGGVCVVAPDGRRATRVVETVVRFKRLTADETRRYLDSGEWYGKAGGYAIQGFAGSLIPWINGSYTNVVGLPLVETLAMLRGLGWRDR
jgi:septum formation protein